jgi:hypothetical protein
MSAGSGLCVLCVNLCALRATKNAGTQSTLRATKDTKLSADIFKNLKDKNII